MLDANPEFTKHVLANVTLTFAAASGPDNVTYEDLLRISDRYDGRIGYFTSRAILEQMDRLDPERAIVPVEPTEITSLQGPTKTVKIASLELLLMTPGNPDGASLDDVRAMAARHHISLEDFISWCLRASVLDQRGVAAR